MIQKNKLTVFFDGIFQVRVYERIRENQLEVCKVTFGTEPKDYEVYEFLLQSRDRLRFNPPMKADDRADVGISPKRMRRGIKEQLETTGPETRFQQALKLQQKQCRLQRKAMSREREEVEKERQFELKQQKRKGKHKGR